MIIIHEDHDYEQDHCDICGGISIADIRLSSVHMFVCQVCITFSGFRNIIQLIYYYIYFFMIKLDRVGPVDNNPLHQLAPPLCPKKEEKMYIYNVTPDT